MARLGRREPFKPLLSGLIRYLPAPATPVGSKQFVVSYAARQSANAFRRQRPRVLTTGLIKYAVPITSPPIAKRGYMISQQAVAEAHRRHRAYHPILVVSAAPPPIIPVPRVRPKIKIGHDEAINKSRGRGHEQDVAVLINGLSRSGELSGTLRRPHLGYVPADPVIWGTSDPIPLSEALDRIAAALALLGIEV